jgi:ElaB/YqjD/DUF883 family membrane-anchored ribosome-binding protein
MKTISSNGSGDDFSTRVAGKAHGMVDKAAGAAIDLASTAHSTVDKVASVATSAAGSLQGTGASLKNRGDKMISVLGDYVKENPARAIGIALAVGYILSKLRR